MSDEYRRGVEDATRAVRKEVGRQLGAPFRPKLREFLDFVLEAVEMETHVVLTRRAPIAPTPKARPGDPTWIGWDCGMEGANKRRAAGMRRVWKERQA